MWTLTGFADEISPDLNVQCRVLADLGISHVEVRSVWETNVLSLDDDQLQTVADTLRRNGLTASSIGSPIGKIGIGDDFEAHLAMFHRALYVADVLGASYIRIFSFFIPHGRNPDVHRDDVLYRLGTLVERAKGHDVVLLHENEKEVYGDVPSRCYDIVTSIGSEQLKLTWDAANFVQCGVRPYAEGYALLRPYVDYVQIKDARLADGKVLPAGEGDGQVPETIAALHADGFDGFFSLEPHLKAGHRYGGSSGTELFTTATRAFTGILHAQRIPYE